MVPLILVPLAVIFTFEGFGSALVQRKTIEPAHGEAAMLASLLTGALLTSLVVLLARPVGEPLFGQGPARLLVMISPVFLLAGIGAVSRSLLWRRLDFRRISLIEMLSLGIGSGAAVALAAAAGLDAPAIVLGALCGSLVTTVLLLLAAPPPAPIWHRGALREVMAFGLPASGAGLTYVAITNATLAVAAVRLSAAQVGLFWRAFQLGVIYQEKISGIMIRLAFPVYSRTSDLGQLRRFHERATRIHAAVILPLLSLLIVTAPELVPWLFGPRWAPAVEPVQILCVAGMIAAVLTGYPQIMLAAGKPRALLVFNVVLLGVYLGVSWVAAPHGTDRARPRGRRRPRLPARHRLRRSSSAGCSRSRSAGSSPTCFPPSPAACCCSPSPSRRRSCCAEPKRRCRCSRWRSAPSAGSSTWPPCAASSLSSGTTSRS